MQKFVMITLAVLGLSACNTHYTEAVSVSYDSYNGGSVQIKSKIENCGTKYFVDWNGVTTHRTADLLKENIQTIIKWNKQSGCGNFAPLVRMDSNGGSAAAGRKIGVLFMVYRVQALVGEYDYCASACATAFALAKHRSVWDGGVVAMHGAYNSRTGRCISHTETGFWREALEPHSAQRMINLERSYCGPNSFRSFYSEESLDWIVRKPGITINSKNPMFREAFNWAWATS